MTLIYPSEDLRIMDYNRVLKTLNDLSANDFLEKLKLSFDIVAVAQPVTARYVMSLYLENKWLKCSVKSDVIKNCHSTSTPATDSLDVQILSNFVLRDILGIADVRND